jgi:hypothetical protein
MVFMFIYLNLIVELKDLTQIKYFLNNYMILYNFINCLECTMILS